MYALQPVTSQGFEVSLQNLSALVDQVRDKIEIERLAQYDGEVKLLETSSLCDISAMKGMRDRMSGIKGSEIKSVLSSSFYNPDAMHATMCAVNSVFYTSPFDIGSLYLNGRIRSYVYNLETIAEGNSEIAFEADFDDAKRLFVVKTGEESSASLLHEMIVGLYGTNRLRVYVPNFAYVFGGFKCSPPIVGLDKKMKTWCLNNENPVNYVLYENITPGSSLSAHIREGCSSKVFVNAILQVLYSLILANAMIDFTHYNLTCEKVFLRQLNTPSFIPYITETRKTGYLLTDKVATIIDYEYAHFKTADLVDSMGHTTRVGMDYGSYDFIPYSIFPKISFPISDAYKLLMTSYVAARKYENHEVARVCSDILKFFSSESTDQAAFLQNKYQYTLYRDEKTATLTIPDLCTYIRSVFSTEAFICSLPDKEFKVLSCDSVFGVCQTEEGVYKSIGLDNRSPIKPPNTIIGMYDLGVRLANEKRNDELKVLGTSFDYETAMNNHLARMKEILNELAAYIPKISKIDLSKINIQTKAVLLDVVESYNSIAAMADLATNLKFHYQIGRAVAESYSRKDSIEQLDSLANKYDANIKPFFDQAKVVMIANHNYLETVQITDPDYMWYVKERRRYDAILSSLAIENL